MELPIRLATISLHITLLVGLVLLLQWSLRPWLSPRWRCWLWGLVVLRLCLPVSFGTGWSLYNLIPTAPANSPSSPSNPSPTPQFTRSESAIGAPIETLAAAAPYASQAVAAPRQLLEPSPATPPIPSVPNPTPTPVRTPYSPLQFLILAWLLGAVAVFGRALQNTRRMARWVATGRPATDPGLLAAITQAGRLVGVRTPLQPIELSGLDSPALYGVIQPGLLLPPRFSNRLDPAQLRHVLLHEFAHIRRRDILLNWLLTFLQSLYWFHPLVWFAFHRLRAERELACDEIALQAAGADESEAYGKTLLHLLSSVSRPIPSPGMVGILEGHRDLRRRLLHIAEFRPGRRFGVAAALLVGLAGAVTLTDAQSPAPITPSTSTPDKPSTNLPPVVPLRYTNAFANPESKDFHAGGNWAGAPRGSNVLGGVWFEVDGLIQLTGKRAEADNRGFREFVSLPVPTNRFGSVHLLAATAWSSPANRRVADVIWRYTDGSFKRSPILYTGHLRDWYRRPFEEPHTVHSPFAKAAAVWTSPDSEKSGTALRMYRVTLANPEPSKPVALLQLQSAREDASLLLLATSLDPLAPGERPDPSPDLEPEDPQWTSHLGVTVIDAGSSNVIGGASVVANVRAKVGPANYSVDRTYPANGSGVADVLLPSEGLQSITVTASAKDYGSSRLTLDSNPTNPPPAFVTVRLQGGIEIGGIILDSNGNPVPDAKVQIYRFWTGNERPNQSGEQPTLDTQQKVTGTDGRWEASGIPKDLLHRVGFNVLHDDYVPVSIHAVGASTTQESALREKRHEVRLVSALKVSGIVVDVAGQPVPGADVRLGLKFHMGTHSGRTDATGHFSLGGQKPGQSVISARAKGHGPVAQTLLITTNMPEVRITLTNAATFLGRVVDPDGNPLENAWVSTEHNNANSDAIYEELSDFNTRTDADGRWTWDSAPHQPVKFQFSKEGFATKSGVFLKPNEEEQVVTLNLPRQVEGIVVDEDSGDPVSDFNLEPRGSWWSREDAQDFKSENGRFSMTLDKDHYDKFHVTSPSHEPRDEPIPAAVNGVIQMTIRLKLAEEFSGTVVDASGRPVANATVAVSSPQTHLSLGGGRLESFSGQEVQVTGPDGSFRLGATKQSSAVVAATAHGFGHSSLDEFRSSRRIVLQPYGRAEGTYRGPVDASGTARLMINAFSAGNLLGIHWSGGQAELTQVASGKSFTLEQVPVGTHRLDRLIALSANSWQNSPLQQFEIRPGETTTLDIDVEGVQVTARLVFPPGHDFTGFHRDASINSPPPFQRRPGMTQDEIATLLKDPAVMAAMRSMRRYPVQIRPDGTLIGDGIPHGPYELTLYLSRMDNGKLAESWTANLPFTVPEGSANNSTLHIGDIHPTLMPTGPTPATQPQP